MVYVFAFVFYDQAAGLCTLYQLRVENQVIIAQKRTNNVRTFILKTH